MPSVGQNHCQKNQNQIKRQKRFQINQSILIRQKGRFNMIGFIEQG